MRGTLLLRLGARNMGRSRIRRCEVLLRHRLLLVFWPPSHLYCLSSLSPFFSCISRVLLGVSRPAAILVCLSGMNGSTLWLSPLPEEARDITCLDLIPGSVAETICLVTGTHKMFSAFNATSGKDHFPQKPLFQWVTVSGQNSLVWKGPYHCRMMENLIFLLGKVSLKVDRERVWIDWVIDPRLNLFGVRLGLNWIAQTETTLRLLVSSLPAVYKRQPSSVSCIWYIRGPCVNLAINHLSKGQGRN